MTWAALYERVSTDAQAERYDLSAQDWALKKRARERSYILVSDGEQDAFVGDGYSGGDLNRPALARLRQAVREGRINVVLCYDPDRLSRSLSDLLLLTDEEEFYQVEDALLRWNQVYETVRPHQALGYKTPERFCQDWLITHTARKEALSDVS